MTESPDHAYVMQQVQQNMSPPPDAGGRSRLPLGRRRMKIEGNQEGDVWSDRPVTVTGDASLAGNIIAPRLIVAGQVYGSVATRELLVRRGGCIWGDAHVVSLRLEAGGRIAGWLGDIDETTFQAILDNGSLPSPPGDKGRAASRVDGDADQARSHRADLEELRRLRTALNAALADHAELKGTFDQKVIARAGETMSRAGELEQEVAKAQADVATLNLQIDRLRQERDARDQLVAHLEEATTLLESQLEDREAAYRALEADTAGLQKESDALRSAQKESDARAAAGQQETDTLLERISGLEAALQASLQHGSEQEQSLLRWQQLADDTEAELRQLQEETASQQRQLDAAEVALDRFRLSQQELEEALADRNTRLEENEVALERHAERFRRTDGALKDALAEIEELRRSYGTGALGSARELVRTKEQREALKEELAASQEVGRQLADALAKSDETAEKQKEQLLWFKVNLESSTQEVERAREQLATMEARLKASELETQRNIEELESQGQQLAEAQAVLSEREQHLGEMSRRSDEAIRRMEDQLRERANLISRMKQVTSARIAELEAQLAVVMAGQGIDNR